MSLIFSLTVAFISSPTSWAESPHSHASSPAGEKLELKLNQGKKWETDKPLREGMQNIKKLLESDMTAIHEEKLSEASYSTLSQKITVELNKIFKNCKLKAAADAMLHLILAQVMKGAAQMKSEQQSSGRLDGAVTVMKALDQYAQFFDHPGWKPIQH